MINQFDKDVEEVHYAMRLLLAVDQFVNVLLWNGSHNETISSNIGRDIENGEEITFASRIVCKVLKKLQSKHCIKSIGE